MGIWSKPTAKRANKLSRLKLAPLGLILAQKYPLPEERVNSSILTNTIPVAVLNLLISLHEILLALYPPQSQKAASKTHLALTWTPSLARPRWMWRLASVIKQTWEWLSDEIYSKKPSRSLQSRAPFLVLPSKLDPAITLITRIISLATWRPPVPQAIDCPLSSSSCNAPRRIPGRISNWWWPRLHLLLCARKRSSQLKQCQLSLQLRDRGNSLQMKELLWVSKALLTWRARRRNELKTFSWTSMKKRSRPRTKKSRSQYERQNCSACAQSTCVKRSQDIRRFRSYQGLSWWFPQVPGCAHSPASDTQRLIKYENTSQLLS